MIAPYETFPALTDLGPAVAHAFVQRVPGVILSTDRAEVLRQLEGAHRAVVAALGFAAMVTAEQTHSADVAVVRPDNPSFFPQVDGLVTNEPDRMLGIYVADCAPIYLVDPQHGAVGLLHSGRKGTEGNIVGNGLRAMAEAFGTRPADVVVQIGPCIRPPHFEVDNAARIRTDALAAGVRPEHLHDCGICTAVEVGRYYSYRIEKGCTGRMVALLAWRR
jgi:polyphenol oxidase